MKKLFLFLIAVSLCTGRLSKTYPSFLNLKEGSTFLTKPLFNGLYTPFGSPVPGGQKPQEREDVTALRCSEPLRYEVGGPSKVFAKLCGMGPPGYYGNQLVIILLNVNAWVGVLNSSSLQYRSALVATRMRMFFSILPFTGAK